MGTHAINRQSIIVDAEGQCVGHSNEVNSWLIFLCYCFNCGNDKLYYDFNHTSLTALLKVWKYHAIGSSPVSRAEDSHQYLLGSVWSLFTF